MFHAGLVLVFLALTTAVTIPTFASVTTVVAFPSAASVATPMIVPVQVFAAGGVVVPGVSQAIVVTVAWVGSCLVVGAVLVAGFPRYTGTIQEDAAARPAMAFATGFVGYFGVLVGSMVPFYVGAILEVQVLASLGALVALPGVLVWAITMLVGGCFGVIVVGDWIVGRVVGSSVDRSDTRSWGRAERSSRSRSGDQSPVRSLVVATLVLAPTQLVPILGSLVTIGVATLGGGTIALRWYESRWPEASLDDRESGRRAPSDREPDRAPVERASWKSSADGGSSEAGSDRGRSDLEPMPTVRGESAVVNRDDDTRKRESDDPDRDVVDEYRDARNRD